MTAGKKQELLQNLRIPIVAFRQTRQNQQMEHDEMEHDAPASVFRKFSRFRS